MNSTFGYDIRNKKFVDMLSAGIIDPVKVTRIALQNAASVASMIMTTECAIVETTTEKTVANTNEY